MLDTQRHVETPEGVELALPLAGPVARARAWFYDLLIKSLLLLIAAIVLSLLGASGAGLYLVFLFVVTWLYPVLFEVLFGGATPGKRIVGLRVVHDDGLPVGWSAAMIRSLVGYVDMMPLVYTLGLVTTLLNDDGKRLGDLAAGTVVIHAQRVRPRVLRLDVPPMRPPVLLEVDEQRGLVEFAARSGRLSHERLDELARIATPLTSGTSDRVRELLGQARWVSGDR